MCYMPSIPCVSELAARRSWLPHEIGHLVLPLDETTGFSSETSNIPSKMENPRHASGARQGSRRAPGTGAETDAIEMHSRSAAITRPARTATSLPASIPDEPPHFRIDLSLPPEQRYLAVCAAFKEEMLGLTVLFDEVVGEMLPFLPIGMLRFLSRVSLPRVYDDEENAELKGIASATGVQMFLLVCFNVLLDLFMGCSSGGVPVGVDGEGERDGPSFSQRMLLFRTLDWDMPSLRRVIVQLDFVTETDGPVIASSITYAGFVGVLTGVRKNLGMSLNFRPNRIDNGHFWADAKYALHLLMVLIGLRPSISSHLRTFLLPRQGTTTKQPPTYEQTVSKVSGNDSSDVRPLQTTACYLCFSNGIETTVIEKDRISAVSRTAADFIIITNNDQAQSPQFQPKNRAQTKGRLERDDLMAAMMEEAQDRLECARGNWRELQQVKATRARLNREHDAASLMRSSDVVEMVQMYPTTNECTRFACVMDPSEGVVVWCRRWKKPLTARHIRENSSGSSLSSGTERS